MERCTTGKRTFDTEQLAEDELVRIHVKYQNSAIRRHYKCNYCNGYHLTSQGDMTNHLDKASKSGEIDKRAEAEHWESKWKR